MFADRPVPDDSLEQWITQLMKYPRLLGIQHTVIAAWSQPDSEPYQALRIKLSAETTQGGLQEVKEIAYTTSEDDEEDNTSEETADQTHEGLE